MVINCQEKIVFLGTPEFSVKILEIMKQSGFTPNLIITAPDKPVGRKMELTPSPVKSWAKKNNIPVEYDYKSLIAFNPDLCIVASFGKIIPVDILKIPKYGFINVHPSLLYKFRGASPIQSAMLSGEKETGVTIMLMNEKMDEGPILTISNLKSQISKLSYKELEEKLAELGGELLVETIPKWIKGEIKPKPQEHEKATYCKKITKEDGLIDWSETPEIIERKIRAYNPWPGAYTFIDGKRLIIAQAERKNTSLKIKRVKPEGKNEMIFEDYLRGNADENLKKYL